MTGEQIIKALECCSKETEFICSERGCPLRADAECTSHLSKYALDLINRQKAELQKAKAELKEITEKFNCQQYVYADLSKIIKEQAEELKTSKAEIERLKLITTNKPYCVSIGTADIFTENHEEYEWLLARISAEAIKEFAEKVKTAICQNTTPEFGLNGNPILVWNAVNGYDDIDNLLKEKVGEG